MGLWLLCMASEHWYAIVIYALSLSNHRDINVLVMHVSETCVCLLSNVSVQSLYIFCKVLECSLCLFRYISMDLHVLHKKTSFPVGSEMLSEFCDNIYTVIYSDKTIV